MLKASKLKFSYTIGDLKTIEVNAIFHLIIKELRSLKLLYVQNSLQYFR